MTTAKPSPLDGRIVRATLIIVAAGVVIAGVRFFQIILTPLVVATFLLLLIDALSGAAERIAPKAPGWARGGVAAAIILVMFALLGGAMALQAPAFANRIQALQPRLDQLLVEYGAPLGVQARSVNRLISGVNVWSVAREVFATAKGIVSYGVLVMIYLGFLVASRATFGRKINSLYDTEPHREAARRVVTSVRRAVEQYVKLQTVKSAITAIVAFAVLTAVGMHDAVFLAFVVFIAVYVPVVGPAVGVILPVLLTLAQFGELGRPAIVFVVMEVTVFVIGNVLMPKLQADELNLDPLLVLMSLGFWGLLLGIPGVVLSTPLTVTVMAVAYEFEGARWLAVLLSRDGHPMREA